MLELRGSLEADGAALAAYVARADGDANVARIAFLRMHAEAVYAALTDVTVEAVRPLFEKELPGFGELFRMLSYAEVGSAAMLSRATAGIARGRAILGLPGSPHALGLAMERLVLPEIAHLLSQARR